MTQKQRRSYREINSGYKGLLVKTMASHLLPRQVRISQENTSSCTLWKIILFASEHFCARYRRSCQWFQYTHLSSFLQLGTHFKMLWSISSKSHSYICAECLALLVVFYVKKKTILAVILIVMSVFPSTLKTSNSAHSTLELQQNPQHYSVSFCFSSTKSSLAFLKHFKTEKRTPKRYQN